MVTEFARLRRRGSQTAAMFACATALLSSCGGGTEPNDRGSYRATITGSVTATAEGPAGFVVSDGQWALVLLPTELEEGWDIFINGFGPRPAVGAIISIRAFDLEDPPSSNEAFADVTQMGPNVFEAWLASAGEIRITASSGSRLRGAFEMSAQSPFVDGPGPITVTGTFDAIFMERPQFPGLAR
jgi:hypothetical protein